MAVVATYDPAGILKPVAEGMRTVEAFEERRAAAADRVRFRMLGNDSRNCHVMAAIQPKRKRHRGAQRFGNVAGPRAPKPGAWPRIC